MLTRRGPAAGEPSQPAAGGMQFFTCLTLLPGEVWGNTCPPGPCFSRGAGLGEGANPAVSVGDSEGRWSALRHRWVMGGRMGHQLGR